MAPAEMPLSRFPVVHTRDVDEAAALYSRLSTPVSIDRNARKAGFEWRANYACLGSVAVFAHRFGSGFTARTESVEGIYSLAIPTGTANAEGLQGGQTVPMANGRSGWMAGPGHRSSARIGSGYEGVNLSVPEGEMTAALSTLLGMPVRGPLLFDPRFSLERRPAAAVVHLLRFAMEELDQPDSSLACAPAAAGLAEALIFKLLVVQPHNYSALLQAPTRAAEPDHVRRVVEYLEAHLEQPIRMSELAALAGVSARALQAGFQRHRGCSPMIFLRNLRLARARALLLAKPGLPVTQVAFACGFEHLGRFSAQYRARFGEAPAETGARKLAAKRRACSRG